MYHLADHNQISIASVILFFLTLLILYIKHFISISFVKNEDMLHDSGRKFYMGEISTLSIDFALINYFLQLKLHSLVQ